MAEARIHLEIEGIVQGVGFRPFLHRLAQMLSLSGWCRNTTFGVELELQGQSSALRQFRAALDCQLPPLARITQLRETPRPVCKGEEGFFIRQSHDAGSLDALVSPDIATCPDCLRELRDPKDRRWHYPFLNCTNCGPRFTILDALPYDRPNTSMAPFVMCDACQDEYNSISSRRYHAQPNCCPDCGPQLRFYANGVLQVGDPLALAQKFLQDGRLVAVKGLGGYHLACRADLPHAVAELRRRKHRDERPLAVMCRDLAAVRLLCDVSHDEERLLLSPRAPIVLLQKHSRAPDILSETRELGVMLPYTPLHHLLMEPFPCLVMTSLNYSNEPVLCDDSTALHAAPALADGVLSHSRKIQTRCDDSLLRSFRGEMTFFRRSRGYVPEPVHLPLPADHVLACGAEQKASFCFTRGQDAFLSQHIGDLKDLQTFQHYQDQIHHFASRFGLQVRQVVCDLHPDYLSTSFAEQISRQYHLPLRKVQHHHAHMAACMADHGLTQPCIALTWDGTGLGTDGTVWGAECLTGDYSTFQRAATITPIPLPGGDQCAHEIGRIAHSLLWLVGKESSSTSPIASQLTTILQNGRLSPKATSIGRLFDGVYALLTGRSRVTYEGQGAVLLEAMAAEGERGAFPVPLDIHDPLAVCDIRPLLDAILRAKQRGADPASLAAQFMNSLADLALAQCRFARETSGLSTVVLSGGVFLNRYLLPRVLDRLADSHFTPFHPISVSPSDESIALGQAIIAAQGGGTLCV